MDALQGKNRAVDAAKEALADAPGSCIDGSKGVRNVVGGSDLSLYEVNGPEVIRQAVDEDANIIFGVATRTWAAMSVTLITTGFVSKTGLRIREEDEITKHLKGIKTKEELDIRHSRRRFTPSQAILLGR